MCETHRGSTSEHQLNRSPKSNGTFNGRASLGLPRAQARHAPRLVVERQAHKSLIDAVFETRRVRQRRLFLPLTRPRNLCVSRHRERACATSANVSGEGRTDTPALRI